MKHQDQRGEGNREADRRYRKGVEKTVRESSRSERADKARDIDEDGLKKARQAEEKGKSRARK